MLALLIAYDAAGNVIATQDAMVARDPAGQVIGLVDFAAHEAAGGKLRDIWEVAGATGSATWPEWIGARAHDFRVELDGDKRAVALVHRVTGHRRERAAIEQAIAAVAPDELGRRHIQGIVGGPGRPLLLDSETGATLGRTPPGSRPDLPVVGRSTDLTG